MHPVECSASQIATGLCQVSPQGAPPASEQRSTADETSDVAPASNAPYIQRRFVTACPYNTLGNGGDVMCVGAATLCDRGTDMSLTAFWVYSRMFDPRLSEAQQRPFTREPGFVCLGADNPGVPGVVQIAQQVQRDFEKFVVLKGRTRVDPGARSLINIETIFSTPDGAPVDLPALSLSAAGSSYNVIITVVPERYTWIFGDGSTLQTTTPGRPLRKDVTHTYDRTGAVAVRVDIEWSGSFTINGGEAIPVRGRARTAGSVTNLDVRAARSELVSR